MLPPKILGLKGVLGGGAGFFGGVEVSGSSSLLGMRGKGKFKLEKENGGKFQ